MKAFRSALAVIFFWSVVGGCIGGLGWINFKFWRLQHPQAPVWTFFLRRS